MRTTIRLDDALLRRAKVEAAMTGRSLNDLISEALRAALAPPSAATLPVLLPTDGTGGLRPGVHLENTGALLDLMDGLEPTESP